jgi:AcrR family transcriptional regulator
MTIKRRNRGEHTRSGIIQAAYQLFLDQGYHGTSMRQIAQHAGIALGGIYNHFEGKEDIFLAVLVTYHPYHEILPVLQNAQGETIEEFVHDAAEGMISALQKHPQFLNLFLIEIVEFNSRHLHQMFEIYFPQVMDVVGRFAEKQKALKSIPLPIIVRTFISLFFSHYIIESILGEEFPDEIKQNAFEYAIDIFLHGIVLES